MHLKYEKISKTLGPLAARLVMVLHENQRFVFHAIEAEKILEIIGVPQVSENQKFSVSGSIRFISCG